MTNSCTVCSNSFEISDEELNFLDRVSPTFAGKKYNVPVPDRCPNCRLQQRNVHRNEQYMYRNKSAVTGKPLISMYSPDNEWAKDLKLYTHEEWWSDDWDGIDYGLDFDFRPITDPLKGKDTKVRPFFEQFNEMNRKVPKVALLQVDNENSPYTTMSGYCKNSHLINCSENCENCYYGKLIQDSRDVMDSAYAYNSELLYECFSVKNCYNCSYLSYSQNCTDCYFSENLKGCRSCFLSTNLVNKEYYFKNEKLSREEYEAKVKEYMGTEEGIARAKKELAQLRKERIYKGLNNVNCEDCTGDFLLNSQNCKDCYDLSDSQDCRYITVGLDVKDSQDCNNIYIKNELCYEVLSAIGIYRVLFSLFVFESQDILYSQYCFNSKNLFGCSGLRKKEYCIFNKQYTKEEYEELVPKIIEHMKKTGEWGQHFPAQHGFFGYNETVAQQYLPLTKEDAVAKGFKWHEEVQKGNKAQTYKIPSAVKDVGDDILDELLECMDCGKNFKVIQQELKRLKSIGLAIPKNCPDCRLNGRLKMRNHRKLYDRKCNKCDSQIKSTFATDRAEKVYCEACYLKEVY